MTPVVRVVGLGPGNSEYLTQRSARLVRESSVVRFRTLRHPAAADFLGVESYDELYERADSYEELYAAIAEDLVRLAHQASAGEVLYVVPGSPVVAERTVELLRERRDVTVITEPAVSVIDLACAALGADPMSVGLRVVDALGSEAALQGPGPMLVLQTYSPEVLAVVAERLYRASEVTVLHHLGLADQEILRVAANDLPKFDRADHLTSLWVPDVRDPGAAMGELWHLIERLRLECPWDQEQTHASLTNHLLEEAYEAIDALEALARASESGVRDESVISHVEEELGDLLVQVLLHAVIGAEDDEFDLTSIAERLRDKLIYRHPHVFGDVSADSADDVAQRWEVLKRSEKGRASVTDGIEWQLPALTLYTKLLRKAATVSLAMQPGDEERRRALAALESLEFDDEPAGDTGTTSRALSSWGDAIVALVSAARYAGVDLEGVLRERALALRDAIREREAEKLAD
ncbi:MAG TPA: MazG nucleotide pyrophosphohydrolase domain-containing protein [Acidimicrobiales bacterium]|nr:MazG nucleotide pyrophosphohydrolase domain-containing protein [Acidimicrobiales bacterium]